MINPFVQYPELKFNLRIDKFPAKNTRRWRKETVAKLHELIKNGTFGFQLMKPEEYPYFLDLSLSPYKLERGKGYIGKFTKYI